MKSAILLCGFASLLVLPLLAVDKCPVCGGAVTTVGKITDDETKPSKNQWVWNRSSCANLLFDEDSLICTRCWFAEDGNEPTTWMRSSVLPDSFFIPLTEAIRGFPAPKNSASYYQRFVGKQRIESLSFWCADSAELITSFRKYCREHVLTIELKRSERFPNEVFVDVGQKPNARHQE